ncbi:hypothetical protein PNEG_03034 [Pneumocystis murina B123]|uniref:Uncharacterized protein n=1 Tax=Pneumocystis murina (strain B123) TaxID=1069680 RepID=M7NIX1_PNEMU|nr:hypothetical protein PNEG_03034 [Pneumocystis murina B123]EMR08553.1 hypothetical protein PNEG_03034 [Pneumocystis murina B123]
MHMSLMIKGFFIIIFFLIESFYCKLNTDVLRVKRQRTYDDDKLPKYIERFVIRLPQQKHTLLNTRKKCLDSFKANTSYLDSSWTQKKPFLIIQNLIGPYNLHLVHLANSMRICRDNIKNVKVALSEHVNNKGYSRSLQKVDLYQEVRDKDSKYNKVFGRICRKCLYSFIKTRTSKLDNFKHKSNPLLEGRNSYLATGSLSLYKYRHGKRINKRSYILGHRSKTCNSVFEGSGINGKAVKCFENILKKIRCGNSFNAICICDSVEYLKHSQECLRTLSRVDALKAREHHQKLCENPEPPPKECVNKPKQDAKIISCPKPYENFRFNPTTRNCARDAIRNSFCTDFFDVSCLCDSISYKNMLSQCISDTIASVNMIHDYHQILCKNPLSLSGCSTISVKEFIEPVKCESMFKDIVPEGDIQDCLKRKAFASRCGNDFDVPCICDSFIFVSTAYTCFPSFFDQESQRIFSAIKSFCEEPRFHRKCIGERSNTSMRRICPGFYEGYGFDDATKRCIIKLSRKSYCSDSLDIVCLCDSLVFINGLVKCFASEPYNGIDKMMNFFEELCFNPYSYSGCKSFTALSVLNVDTTAKGLSGDNKTSKDVISEKKLNAMASDTHQHSINKSQTMLTGGLVEKEESNKSYHCGYSDNNSYIYINGGNNLLVVKMAIWLFIIITICMSML